MKPNRVPNNIKLTSADIEAIICALPLVANIDAPTLEQTQLNNLSCTIAMNKLLARNFKLNPNEIRVITLAIEFAQDVLSGSGNQIIVAAGVDTEWRNELSKNLFIYNRLEPLFDDLYERIERNLN